MEKNISPEEYYKAKRALNELRALATRMALSAGERKEMREAFSVVEEFELATNSNK